MKTLDGELSVALAELERANLKRGLREISSEHDAYVEFDGRRMLMLSSNNYLGLASHPALKRAAAAAVENWGVGAGASRLIAGSLKPLHDLERQIARFKGLESALVFGSGYLANLGVLSALAGPGDVIFSDELNHASLIDGCRLSKAAVRIYRHRDVSHLAAMLPEAAGARRRLIVTDSVFSMDGDLAPLADLVELARTHRAATVVDEAHGLGVFGPHGEGLASELGLEREIDIHVGTLSKALGSYGAYVAGSQVLTDFLINRARSLVFSTGLSPAMAAAAGAAIDLLEADRSLIAQLWDNARYLKQGLERAGFQLAPTASPILPVMVGESASALEMAAALFERGFYVIAIRPPTVPPGTARLRLTPTAAHTRADLDRTLTAFGEIRARLP
jgi:8-amino-7-oxononanoate synthase